jgi:hypothetical protein
MSQSVMHEGGSDYGRSGTLRVEVLLMTCVIT